MGSLVLKEVKGDYYMKFKRQGNTIKKKKKKEFSLWRELQSLAIFLLLITHLRKGTQHFSTAPSVQWTECYTSQDRCEV